MRTTLNSDEQLPFQGVRLHEIYPN